RFEVMQSVFGQDTFDRGQQDSLSAKGANSRSPRKAAEEGSRWRRWRSRDRIVLIYIEKHEGPAPSAGPFRFRNSTAGLIRGGFGPAAVNRVERAPECVQRFLSGSDDLIVAAFGVLFQP